MVATTKKVLDHKKGNDGYEWYYWKLPKMPKQLAEGDRIHFAVNKKVQGSFKIESIDRPMHEVEWNADSWQDEKKDIPSKVRQGFAYKWW